MRIALCIEYNGFPFRGWQSQSHGNTVQDFLQGALSKIAAARIAVVCAGRTDAGVHAQLQIAHFDTESPRPMNAWVRGTNSHLPDSIAVRWAQEVDAQFHARFSAVARSYRYVLHNAPVRPALNAGRVGWYHAPLSADAMQAAAHSLVGEHDFTSFRGAQCQAKSPVRTVHSAQVRRYGDFVVFDFRANAFLHHMVRNLVGALVFVGKGKHTPGWIEHLLSARDRTLAAPTFSAAGLYLAGVEYAPHWRLPGDGRIIAPFEPPPH